MRRSQIWSTDVMIAAGIFVVGLIIFFVIMTTTSRSHKMQELTAEADTLATAVVTTEKNTTNLCTLVFDNVVDKAKISECASNYKRAKSALGIKNDFCIHFEDEQGNIINLSSLTGREAEGNIGIGSDDINFTIVSDEGEKLGVVKC